MILFIQSLMALVKSLKLRGRVKRLYLFVILILIEHREGKKKYIIKGLTKNYKVVN